MLLLGNTFIPCVNLDLNGCSWIPDVAGEQCFACSLTRTRPADDDLEGLPQYYRAEQAKRRLVYELDGLGLPLVPRDETTGKGITFDLLSSVEENVVTGHADGVITLDLAEGDTVHREKVKESLGEAYRTLLGHFRHEIGHYHWQVLVDDRDGNEACREVFGDETFAHVLHIADALDTAHAFGLTVDPMVAVRRFSDVVVGTWMPLAIALNQLNRSLGEGDLYPFVLAPAVIDKLEWVNALVRGAGSPP